MKNNRLNVLIIAIFGIIMLSFAFIADEPKVLLSAIISAKPFFLLCAGLCMVAYWMLEACTFQSVCKGINSRISFKDCFSTSMVGQLFNCITPFASGGQPAQAYRLVKCGMELGKASCALLAKFIIYQFVLTFYTFVVICLKLKFFLTEISGFAILILVGFAINLLVMFFLLGIGFFPKPTTAFLLHLSHFLNKIKIIKNRESMDNKIVIETGKFYENFAILKANPQKFILPAIITVFQLTAFFTVPYFVCLSLSATKISFLTVICAAAFVLLISSFVPLPGATGGAEGGFYLFFEMFFVHTGFLSIAILLWRVFTFYMPIVSGMFFLKNINRKAIKSST